jgi:hypothetical protein
MEFLKLETLNRFKGELQPVAPDLSPAGMGLGAGN